jgi:MFS family permease
MASTGSSASEALTHPAGTEEFVRDKATVLSYAALGCYTFWLYAFAPAVTLLREELGFSYAMLGLYSVFWSVGAAVAGLAFTWVASRLSRGAHFWSSAAIAVIGAALFTLTRGIGATLVGAALFGFAGTMLLAVIQGILSERHGSRRDKALTEANIGGGLSSILAPLVLGALAITALGWRVTFALPAVIFVLLFVIYRNGPFRAIRQEDSTTRSGGLSLRCWMFIGLMAVGSAIEFCLVYFAPQSLIAIGLSTTAASTALVSNYVGILVGRMAGAALTRRPGRAGYLLSVSLVATAASFLLFWCSSCAASAWPICTRSLSP